MTFEEKKYIAPDFNNSFLENAPDVTLVACPDDGIAPENFHALSIFPEYFKVNGKWILAKNSRMDTVAVIDNEPGKEHIEIVEFRRLKKGDLVAIGRTEDGTEGIYLHSDGFVQDDKSSDKFAFRSGRSRETAFSIDYDRLYEILKLEKKRSGKITWILGTSIALDQATRNSLVSIIEKGLVDTIICGNSLAAFDLEMASFNSVWGQKVFTSEQNSFFNFAETINMVRDFGSIKSFVESGIPKNGFVKACIEHGVNLVLVPSIRDRLLLPDTHVDVYKAQDAMREKIKETSVIIMVSSILLSIASGNMTPSYNVFDDEVRPIYMYMVDIQEFAVNKLSDRGTLTAKTVVTNAQDFMRNIARAIKD